MARKIPASLTKAYNRAIKRQGGAAERTVKAALEEYIAENPEATVEELREYAIELMRAAGDLYGNACSQAAFDLQDEIAREFATKPPDVSGWMYEPDEESISKTAHYHAGKLADGDVEGFVREISQAARFYTERGANATMVETAKKQDRDGKRSRRLGARTHGVTFARVPQGATTCEFCLMLASRGFVYLSEESAGEFDRFHKHCDCRIVPGYPGMELEGYDPDLYYDMWKNPEKYQEQTQEQPETQPLRMTGKETYSYYSSNVERIRDWLRGVSEFDIPEYDGRNNDERANLLIRRDADMLRELLRQSEKYGLSEYEKTLEDFKKKKDDEKELFVHASLIRAGLHIKTRKDDGKDKNETSVDLKIGSNYWEIKSPTSDGSAPNSLGFVEKNLKKARRQFSLDEKAKGEPVRVIFNCRYTTVPDDDIEAEIRKKMHLPNVGVSEVMMVCKDGKLKEIN